MWKQFYVHSNGSGCNFFFIHSFISFTHLWSQEGYNSTGVDIVELALDRGRKMTGGDKVTWINADLLDSIRCDFRSTYSLTHLLACSPDRIFDVLMKNKYDIVFDMQCFHVLRDSNELAIVNVICELAKPKGYIVLVAGKFTYAFIELIFLSPFSFLRRSNQWRGYR